MFPFIFLKIRKFPYRKEKLGKTLPFKNSVVDNCQKIFSSTG
ncbi:hypothetical protein B4064_2748 [Caldibacillus thermoamylovorans]|nr:hypothetical protein B4064_2748 [Caldibacillus thermoamylovorans]KIO66332.1 hypothetical protein B4065_2364 [Caldibacillus thermoamylovorans]